MCVSITCWQHTPTTHFMFVSFHDDIRILAYPWQCTNRLCPLVFFCVAFCSTNVCSVALYGCLPFLSCAYRLSATLCLCFVFLTLRLHSEHCLCLSFVFNVLALPLCVVVRGSSPHHRLSFLLSSVLCLCVSLPLLHLSTLCLCFDDVNRCASS